MTLDYKNSTIEYTVNGSGSAIVLLHGFLESKEMWRHVIPQFADNHCVIAIDLLGHGKTGCIGYIHTMEAMAEAVFAVLKHLNIKKAKLIGHSMGGYVALALAEKQPHFFDGLCLMNSTFEADDKERKLLRTRANKMVQTNFENLVRMSFANLFAPESKEKFKAEFDEALDLALQTPPQGYIAAQEGMKLRPNRFEVFKNLKGKKLIIIGKKDSVINAEKLIGKIKDTTIEYVEFSEGHMSHIENKSELSYFLKQFIEK
ncbi:alpha/beta fold hydrolase [Winogradskyella pulchriflava]|uniref:Alpha/beta fold hydrolase n=1 Tax=Winogradskyella pulchriflava TaxID=1110688 RepID=A0ABV6Q5T0_9FLAO